MEGFELYAMYRKAAVDNDYITATWEGLTNRNRDLWNEVARGVTVIISAAEEEAVAEASPGTKVGERTDY